MSADLVLIGAQVKRFRKMACFTQENLAECTSLTVQHIGNIETGRKGASVESLIGIAEALDVTVDILLRGNYGSKIAAHVCEFAELMIEYKIDERDAIFEATIAVAKAFRGRECRK